VHGRAGFDARQVGQLLRPGPALPADDGRDLGESVKRGPEPAGVPGEYRARADQLGDRLDPGVVAALQRVRHADRGDRDAGRHRSQRHQQVIHAVAGQHQQRPARAQPAIEQRLTDRVRRRHGLAVRPAQPRAVRTALGDQQATRSARAHARRLCTTVTG
jgi:hypothetical protein